MVDPGLFYNYPVSKCNTEPKVPITMLFAHDRICDFSKERKWVSFSLLWEMNGMRVHFLSDHRKVLFDLASGKLEILPIHLCERQTQNPTCRILFYFKI